MLIRQEKTEDISDVHALNKLAFSQPQEADIVANHYQKFLTSSLRRFRQS
jgi:predicted N-acetyltransferase YhbS